LWYTIYDYYAIGVLGLCGRIYFFWGSFLIFASLEKGIWWKSKTVPAAVSSYLGYTITTVYYNCKGFDSAQPDINFEWEGV